MTNLSISLTVNGHRRDLKIEARTLLVEVLRNGLGLTGTHVGCDTSQCGACTVHLAGRSVKSCSVLAVECDGEEIVTIEGIAGEDGALHPMQKAFGDCHGLQCGYCTPGMIMTAVSIVEQAPHLEPSELREELHGNLCRCTGYQNIIKAVVAGRTAMLEG
jgi:aerobic carbon-monoxide dehydrogenase small subunit